MKRKAKHVLGKKIKIRPQTQGEFFFFAQNMLRLSGQAAQELQVAQVGAAATVKEFSKLVQYSQSNLHFLHCSAATQLEYQG